jgi:hypothetical protein
MAMSLRATNTTGRGAAPRAAAVAPSRSANTSHVQPVASNPASQQASTSSTITSSSSSSSSRRGLLLAGLATAALPASQLPLKPAQAKPALLDLPACRNFKQAGQLQ